MSLRKFIPLTFSCFLVAALAPPAPAAVFERDWKTPGDGLLTYDDVNRREWLDIPESLLSQFPANPDFHPRSLEASESRYQNAILELKPHGLFECFNVAKQADVAALAMSSGINIASTSLADNEDTARRLINLLGETIRLSGGQTVTWGMLDDLSILTPATRIVAGVVVAPPTDTANFGVFPFSEFSIDGPAGVTGVFLYRNAIPEPASIIMISCLLIYVAVGRVRHCS